MSADKLHEGIRSIVYQQFYVPEDMIVDRSRLFKIKVEGSGRIVNRVVDTLQPLAPLWRHNKRRFGEALSARLRADPQRVEETLREKMMVDPYDDATWSDMGLLDDQVYLLIIGHVFQIF